MTKPTYTPKKDSLAERVCGYLQNNPVMALSLEDITDTFDTARGNIHTQLANCVDAGLLKRVQVDDGEYLYQPGPALPRTGANIDTTHSQRKPRQASVLTDPSALEIRDDPLPTNRAAQPNKYFATFDLLPLGKCVRCQTGEIGRVSAGLRKYIEVKRIKGMVRTIKRFEGDDGFGRVWLLPVPVKALKAVA